MPFVVVFPRLKLETRVVVLLMTMLDIIRAMSLLFSFIATATTVTLHDTWFHMQIANACTLFKEEDKSHMNFAFMHCWKVLKDKPKCQERTKHNSSAQHGGKKQKTTADASPSAATLAVVAGNVHGGQPSGSAQERPPRKKKELQMLRQRASMEAMELHFSIFFRLQ